MQLKTTLVALGAASALALAAQALAQSNVYRWTDKDGKVHFSDSPPPEEAKDVTRKTLGGGPAGDSSLPYETQVAMKRNPVTVYVGDRCAPCDNARALLSKRGIPYTERNAQGNAQEIEALQKITGGPATVPVLVVGSSNLKGFDEDGWNAALDSAGYPRSVLPGRTAPEPVRVGGPAKSPAAAPDNKPQQQ
jgi:glutaredoxin